MISPTMNVDTRNENIPADLKAIPNWMTWSLVNGTKIPSGKSNDSWTWTNFERVKSKEKVAYVFSESCPFVGIDIDDCLVDGEFTPFAKEILEQFRGKAYAEISPSGTGVKLWARGTKPKGYRCKNGSLEVYDNNRFFAVTGDVIEGFGNVSVDVTPQIEELCKRHLAKPEQTTKTVTAPTSQSYFAVDQERRLRSIAKKFEPLSEGGRNAAALIHAGYLRSKVDVYGVAPSEDLIIEIMREWNATNTPPLSDDELLRTIENSKKGTPPANDPPQVMQTIMTETDTGFIESANPIDFTNLNRSVEDLEFPPPPPGLVSDVVAFNLQTAHRRQPTLALVGALSLQAAIIARKVRLENGTRPSIGFVSLAKTGSGKNHARLVNAQILTDAENDKLLLGEAFTSDFALFRGIQEVGCGLIQLDELGRMLKGSKSPNNAEYRLVTSVMIG